MFSETTQSNMSFETARARARARAQKIIHHILIFIGPYIATHRYNVVLMLPFLHSAIFSEQFNTFSVNSSYRKRYSQYQYHSARPPLFWDVMPYMLEAIYQHVTASAAFTSGSKAQKLK